MLIAPDGVDLVRYARPAGAARGAHRSGADQQFFAGLTCRRKILRPVTPAIFTPGVGRGLLLDLAQRLPQITFMVAGGEPAQVTALRGEAEKRGLKNMYITGFIPNAELPLVQAACDVLLMPLPGTRGSLLGWGYQPLFKPDESLRISGVRRGPIVVSDLPVFGEIFNDNNCVRIVHNDVDEWARALLALQNDPGLCDKLARSRPP